MSSTDDFDDMMRQLQAQSKRTPMPINQRAEAQRQTPFDRGWHVLLGCKGVPQHPVCKLCVARSEGQTQMIEGGVKAAALREGPKPMIRSNLVRDPELTNTAMDIEVAPAADLFGPEVTDAQRDLVFNAIAKSPHHRFFVSTKFIDKANYYLRGRMGVRAGIVPWPQANVWLGISVSSAAEYRASILPFLNTPAAHHYVAFDPLMEHIAADFQELENRDRIWPLQGLIQKFDGDDWAATSDSLPASVEWVLMGGLVADVPRPPSPHWVRAILYAAAAQQVPVFFMGWGSWQPVVGKPEPDRDSSLLFVDKSGLVRGQGAGEDSNDQSDTVKGAIADFFTQRGDLVDVDPKIDAHVYQQHPPSDVLLDD